MNRFAAFVRSLKRRQEGQDLLEYALLVALIAVVAAVAVEAAGLEVTKVFESIVEKLKP